MKITIVGGGPAGLYFALLMKKRDPAHEVTLFERDPRDDTFGWGVVFSEQTFSYLEGPRRAEPSARSTACLERWDNVDIVHRGEKVTIRGNRFSGDRPDRLPPHPAAPLRGAGGRPALRDAGRAPGRRCPPCRPAGRGRRGPEPRPRALRRRLRPEPRRAERNKYIWFGTPRLFHGLTLTFRENADGLFIGHSYKFSREASTFIVECDPETWQRAGLDEQVRGGVPRAT